MNPGYSNPPVFDGVFGWANSDAKASLLSRLSERIGLIDEPMAFVDVGASLRRTLLPSGLTKNLDLLAIEPLALGDRPPDSARFRTGLQLPVVVGGRRRKVRLKVTRKRACSSVYLPERSFLRQFPRVRRFDVMRESPVDQVTLDGVTSSNQKILLLKIDAQGGAFPVLKGARKTLSRTACLVVEVEVSPIYDGQARFSDVVGLLEGSGFRIIDAAPSYWSRTIRRYRSPKRGELIFFDLTCVQERRISSLSDQHAFMLALLLVQMNQFDLACAVLANRSSELVRSFRDEIDLFVDGQAKAHWYGGSSAGDL